MQMLAYTSTFIWSWSGPLTKWDFQLFDFVINRFFMKLFTTSVKYCQEYFDLSLPSVLWTKRVAKFEVSFECFFVCAIIVW